MDTKTDDKIPELYPLYVDSWIRNYPELVDNEDNPVKFAESNVEVAKRYRSFLKEYDCA